MPTDQTNATTGRQRPIYNIGVVSRMTGIPAATLRVWERRYDFPESGRTDAGHRLYSEHQVERLRWVKSRIDEGMQTSQAVQALEQLEAENRFPEAPLSPTSGLPSGPGPGALTTFRERLTSALIGHDVAAADVILAELLALVPLEDVILGVIRPTLTEIGEGWLAGKVSVATEHLASNYLRHRLMMWLQTGPTPRAQRPVVLACAPGEWHDGSLLILGVLLRRRRWPVSYLGQSVPLADLASFLRQANPPAVIMVAMTEGPAAALAEWPEAMPDVAASGRPEFCFGGRVFSDDPEWRERVPGVFLGDTIEEGLATLESILVRTTPG